MWLTHNEQLVVELSEVIKTFVKTERTHVNVGGTVSWVMHSIIHAGWTTDGDRAAMISALIAVAVDTIASAHGCTHEEIRRDMAQAVVSSTHSLVGSCDAEYQSTSTL